MTNSGNSASLRLSATIFASLGALVLGEAACSDEGGIAAPPTTPEVPTGSDAGADAPVAPLAVPTTQPDITCSPGEPTSCCYAAKRYGGRAGADTSCGPNGDEDCCKYDDIQGGSFNRLNNPALPATMPNFKLGRYLVTTARFKVWMDEGGGLAANAPAEGAGAHPALPYPLTGWKPEWNASLSATPEDLALKVYKDPGSVGWGCTLDYYPQNPKYPVNCIDYYLMQAYCAWDGGYAITEAMWEYAARGGAEQRPYAWGSEAPDSLDRSVYCIEGGGVWGVDLWCDNPLNPVPLDVGKASKGRGKWGSYDLMGNLLNMTVDEQGDPPASCGNDCVSRPTPAPNRAVARGISFIYPNNLTPAPYTNLMTGRPITVRKNFNGTSFGFRCAYPNSWPTK